MKIAVIPARYSSSRFPGKPLAIIAGKPMIQHVVERVSAVEQLDGVFVATDDRRIFDAVRGFGGNAVMTSADHRCGTDRIAECVSSLGLSDDDLVLDIQGDEPMIRREMILDLISCFDSEDVRMGTLKRRITLSSELDDPNVVKVITDVNGRAIYFSRYCLPYRVSPEAGADHFKHIGVYGYRKGFLMEFCRMPRTPLEISESLEQLRAIENGIGIMVRETEYQTVSVDTPEQLAEVEKIMNAGYDNL